MAVVNLHMGRYRPRFQAFGHLHPGQFICSTNDPLLLYDRANSKLRKSEHFCEKIRELAGFSLLV